jgi:ribosomal protein S18
MKEKDLKEIKNKKFKKKIKIGIENLDFLRKYVTETGKILSRKNNKLSSKNQRKLSKKIKYLRNISII